MGITNSSVKVLAVVGRSVVRLWSMDASRRVRFDMSWTLFIQNIICQLCHSPPPSHVGALTTEYHSMLFISVVVLAHGKYQPATLSDVIYIYHAARHTVYQHKPGSKMVEVVGGQSRGAGRLSTNRFKPNFGTLQFLNSRGTHQRCGSTS